MGTNFLAQPLQWLINNVQFCYDGKSTANNNDYFNSIKKSIKISKKLTQVGQRAWKRR